VRKFKRKVKYRGFLFKYTKFSQSFKNISNSGDGEAEQTGSNGGYDGYYPSFMIFGKEASNKTRSNAHSQFSLSMVIVIAVTF
jgi:hypothetical protein